MQKSTIALALLAVFAAPTYAEKIDNDTVNNSTGAPILVTEDTVFTNTNFFRGAPPPPPPPPPPPRLITLPIHSTWRVITKSPSEIQSV